MESRLPLEPHKGLLSSPASEDATENKNKGTSIIDLKRVNRPSVRLFESGDFARIRENNQWELLYQEIQESDLYHELQNRIKNKTRLKREIEALNEVIRSQNDQVHTIQGSLDNVFKEIESLYCKHLSTDEANAFDKNNKGLCNKAFKAFSREEKNRMSELQQKKKTLLNQKRDLQNQKFRNVDQKNDMLRRLKELEDYRDLKNNFSDMGNIWLQDNTQYFDDTRLSQDCAREFMHALYSDSKLAAIIIEKHDDKVRKSNKDRMPPTNISFIVAQVNKEPVCFVALSRAGDGRTDKELLQTLDRFANQFNTENRPKIRFCVIQYSSQNYQRLIGRVTRDLGSDYRPRTCGEYDYGALVAKLKHEHGRNFVIEGVTNCDLYPYRHGAKYGEQADKRSSAYKVTEPIMHSLLDDRTFILHTKPCCSACQDNRAAYLVTLNGLQQYALRLKEKASQFPPVSPIREFEIETSSLYNFFQPSPTAIQTRKTVLETGEEKKHEKKRERVAESGANPYEATIKPATEHEKKKIKVKS